MKRHINTSICKALIIIIVFSMFSFLFFCKTVTKEIEIKDEHEDFLKSNTETDELFRVLIISNRYDFSQMKFHSQLKKVADPDGDLSICGKLKEYDKINETCEGVLTVWLYPDSGKLMKIRPKILAPIAEINTLIVEDLKRWNFQFSDIVEPNMFDVRYRIVLRKIQSDEDIMKEIREREEKEGKKKEVKEND